ncbi:hypothetical protein LEP1GSC188_1206 [Leptospira weilii serovar Topaz str. LT2116]|uniref:Uncharacterized protein n=1 Tax=Leptospira weilii serovar Topaz str. LT2116 TaxID=1088540 RepID=M3H4L6_9LEPT|nr:hypothetical protein [Leptospira weilii]EMF83730.1 hypothetical protein LEP1GSC188_1206 [Leptospira weilii serovar Topaz str. LT2116]
MRFSFFTTQDLSCAHGNRNSFIERRLDNRNRFIFEFFIRKKSSTKILRGGNSSYFTPQIRFLARRIGMFEWKILCKKGN